MKWSLKAQRRQWLLIFFWTRRKSQKHFFTWQHHRSSWDLVSFTLNRQTMYICFAATCSINMVLLLVLRLSATIVHWYTSVNYDFFIRINRVSLLWHWTSDLYLWNVNPSLDAIITSKFPLKPTLKTWIHKVSLCCKHQVGCINRFFRPSARAYKFPRKLIASMHLQIFHIQNKRLVCKYTKNWRADLIGVMDIIASRSIRLYTCRSRLLIPIGISPFVKYK